MDENERLRKSMEHRNEFEEGLEAMEYNKDLYEKSVVEMSKMLVFRYEALMEAGFTDVQAFAIILQRGIT